MDLKFEEWLIHQEHREDLIGDLTRVLKTQDTDRKPARRKSDEHKNWADIVVGMTEPGFIAVFNEAWQEYLLAKQSALDALS